jgi:hypothetical protein
MSVTRPEPRIPAYLPVPPLSVYVLRPVTVVMQVARFVLEVGPNCENGQRDSDELGGYAAHVKSLSALTDDCRPAPGCYGRARVIDC